MLTEGADSVDWFALRVKSNREKVTVQGLTGKGYEVFLPLYRAPVSNGAPGKERPLFPGYLFCRFDVRKRLPILTVPGIVNIVGIGTTPTPVDEREVRSLRVLVEAGLPLNPMEHYMVGDRVRIKSGPLAGTEGLVHGVQNPYLVVSISILQRSVSVELHRDWITGV